MSRRRKRKTVNVEKVVNYIRQFPNMSHREFIKRSGQKISNPYYYKIRRKILDEQSGGTEQPISVPRKTEPSETFDVTTVSKRKLSREVKALLNYLSKNPNASHSKYCKDTNRNISSNKFYFWRVKMFGGKDETPVESSPDTVPTKSPSRRTKKNLTFNVWNYPTGSITPETRTVVKDLVKTLNDGGYIRGQLVEMVDPVKELQLQLITR